MSQPRDPVSRACPDSTVAMQIVHYPTTLRTNVHPDITALMVRPGVHSTAVLLARTTPTNSSRVKTSVRLVMLASSASELDKLT